MIPRSAATTAWSPLLCLAFCFLLGACGADGSRQELRGTTMGTTWSLVYAAPGEAVEADVLQAQLEAELLAINAALSTYIPDSEISRVNSAATRTPQRVSDRFATVLTRALEIGELTGGAYDVTVGPLVELWGFGRTDTLDRVPPERAIEAARARVGAADLAWNPRSRELALAADMAIDLSSVAKGYAVDRLAAIVESAGVDSYLVEIGGELRAAGERPGGGPWRLAIESPSLASRGVLEALRIGSAAVATSGDYRNFFEVDGVRYSHLVDPRSGYPVTHDLVSVTVVAADCMSADAWATALIVLGSEAGMALAREQELAVYAVSRVGDEFAVEYTEAFVAYLAEEAGQ